MSQPQRAHEHGIQGVNIGRTTKTAKMASCQHLIEVLIIDTAALCRRGRGISTVGEAVQEVVQISIIVGSGTSSGHCIVVYTQQNNGTMQMQREECIEVSRDGLETPGSKDYAVPGVRVSESDGKPDARFS